MTSVDEVVKTLLRNKLLGRWAAERLGLTGEDAEAYSDDLARAAVDPVRCDVFSKIRKDFDDAGVDQSDERILSVMTELMLKAGSLMPGTQGDSADSAAVMIARNLMSH
jgi:hypothetical protein